MVKENIQNPIQDNKKSAAYIPTNISSLDPEEQKKIILGLIEERIQSSKRIKEIAENAITDAINRAKQTQKCILGLNIAMFIFGAALICVAIVVSYSENNSAYSYLFGGVGFLQMVSSFFVGSMERSQKAISDLVQVEIAYLDFFEQVTIWEQYASILDEENRIDKSNIEKAAEKIQENSKEILELLQKKLENNQSKK